MLETEDFDDEYFTPIASASLANIFGKPLVDDKSDNESLKYIPPKPQHTTQQPEESKATLCIFACALVAYLWHNNIYSQKGKLGFALIKILKSAVHNVILYDSNKTTLSSCTITSKLKVSLKGNNYISYYDDQSKYWSLYGSEDEIRKIIEYLKQFGATVVISTDQTTAAGPPESSPQTEILSEPESNKQGGSDTESSENKKTKASILNRMATMGNFILPPKPIIPEVLTSDSDVDYHTKSVKSKFPKGLIKKNSIDKKIPEPQKRNEIHSNDEITQLVASSSITSDQLLPLAQTTFVTHPSTQNMDLFITEQRVNNSELRINLGKMNDKVDNILAKFNEIDLNNHIKNSTNVNLDITNKLLREYENKINVYENLIKQMGGTQNFLMTSSASLTTDLAKSSNSGIDILEDEVKQKDKIIESLESKLKEKDDTLKLIEEKMQKIIHNNEKESNLSLKTINDLEHELKRTQDQMRDLTDENEIFKSKASAQCNENKLKIKTLMNDTFHALVTNFEENETYTGGTIKKTAAVVIKRITLSVLNDNE